LDGAAHPAGRNRRQRRRPDEGLTSIDGLARDSTLEHRVPTKNFLLNCQILPDRDGRFAYDASAGYANLCGATPRSIVF
jgi:hypothetical protein